MEITKTFTQRNKKRAVKLLAEQSVDPHVVIQFRRKNKKLNDIGINVLL